MTQMLKPQVCNRWCFDWHTPVQHKQHWWGFPHCFRCCGTEPHTRSDGLGVQHRSGMANHLHICSTPLVLYVAPPFIHSHRVPYRAQYACACHCYTHRSDISSLLCDVASSIECWVRYLSIYVGPTPMSATDSNLHIGCESWAVWG